MELFHEVSYHKNTPDYEQDIIYMYNNLPHNQYKIVSNLYLYICKLLNYEQNIYILNFTLENVCLVTILELIILLHWHHHACIDTIIHVVHSY